MRTGVNDAIPGDGAAIIPLGRGQEFRNPTHPIHLGPRIQTAGLSHGRGDEGSHPLSLRER